MKIQVMIGFSLLLIGCNQELEADSEVTALQKIS